jgi:hypothetical protein
MDLAKKQTIVLGSKIISYAVLYLPLQMSRRRRISNEFRYDEED